MEETILNKVTYIYYTHPLLIKAIENEEIKEYIDSVLGEDWIGFTNNVDYTWYQFVREMDDEDSFNQLTDIQTGVCLEQFKQMEEGKKYVNPLLIGVMSSFDEWQTFIQQNFGYNTIFQPLYIPYDIVYPIFEKVINEIKEQAVEMDEETESLQPISREEYDYYFEHVKTITDTLNVLVSVPSDYTLEQTPRLVGTA